jgi:hypothetical protein
MGSRRLYAIHRWLGALVGLQLLAWSAGGLIFSTHDLSWVRSERGMQHAPPPGIAFGRVRISPETAAARAGADPSAVELHMLVDRPVYEVRAAERTILVDAENGAVRSPLDRATAVAIARNDRAGDPAVTSVEQVVADPPTEYRGQPLPAWRIAFADVDSTHVYVDATTGAIRARRNDAWRRFDFFWMLHTMDYRGRDDFNHPLLVAFAALGVIAVLSGWVLWTLRLVRRARRPLQG